MEKATIVILLVILLVLGSFAGYLGFISDETEESDDSEDSSNNQNNSVPYGKDFEFSILGGGKKSMADYQGKIVILDFMGANCGPCQKMMVVLKQLSMEYTEIEIVSIDVWVMYGETADTIQQLLDLFSQEGIELDWTFGYDDSSSSLYYEYANGGVPRIYVLDKNGNTYYVKDGYIDGYSDYSLLKEKVDELIE